MSQPSVYPALYIKPPDYANALQQYANVSKTQAETQTEQEKPDYVRSQAELNRANVGLVGAQTTKEQVAAELARLNLGFTQYGLDTIRGGGNAGTEPLPGQANSEGSSYGNLPTLQRDTSQTAGMQANNPGNLMYAGQDGATGTIELSGGRHLAAFPDMATGVAATAHQLELNQDQHGVNTVRQQVTRWVSDPKADLTTYINDTARAIGVGPDDKVDWHDPRVQAAFIKAQYPHESAGGKTTLSDADVNKGVLLAHNNGAPGQPAARTQVAAAGNGPASWGVRSDGTAPPPPPGASPSNALSVANPMGTSSQGMMMPGLGVPLPRAQVGMIWLAQDKAAAISKAMADRRQTLGMLAGSATDGPSWNQAVAQAWRMGYLTNGEFARWYNASDWAAMRDVVVRSMASPEAQVGYQEHLLDKGLASGPGGRPQLDPSLLAGKEPITITEPVMDPKTGQQARDSAGFPMWQKQTYSAEQYYTKFGHLPAGYAPAAPGGGGTAAAPPPAPASAPAPAVGDGTGPVATPPPAQTAPNGGTVSGVGAATPPGTEQVKGTDGNWYNKPAQGGGAPAPAATAGPGAPAGNVPNVSGTVTAPAPGAGGPAGGAGGAAPPIVPPGAGGTAPGAIGGGPVEETPGAKSDIAITQKQREAAIEVEKARQVEANKQAIEIANAGAKKVAEEQGDQAGQIYKNSVLASSSLEKLQILENAAKDVRPGVSAATRTAAVNRIIDTLGLLGVKVPDSLAKQSAAAGAIDKLGGFLAAAQVRMMGDRAAAVFNAVKDINPNLAQSPTAFNAVLQSLKQDAMRDQDLERFRVAWMGSHKNLDGMMDAFNDGHSVNAYASRVIPMQLPSDASKYEVNVVYNTAPGSKARKDGVAKVIWDGKQFHNADQ